MRFPFLILLVLVAAANATPIDQQQEVDLSEQWELVTDLNVSGELPVLKYRSKRTGLTVVLAKAESPVVNCYICLATEAWTNDGLPHTLEHLVFLGSEDYPYKEVLDLMANRCLASRTNAWTDTDHTCYTVYTAGSSGFLNILPVYMDHILFPILREEDFLTEVHHISEKGEDAGVVYSEMQGVENRPSNIIYFNTVNDIYPGNSSFQTQTGGVLKNLRESTTIEKVRDYHKLYYRPENTYITVTGQVEPKDIFKALEKIEQKLLKQTYPPYEKPFTTRYPPIGQDINKEIEYPSDDEKQGHVTFAWRLPYLLWDGYESIQALKILGSYLTSTSISPMKENFVNIPEPLATDVDFDTYSFSQPAVSIDFENVPIAKMTEIEDKFRAVVKKILDDGPEKLNMDRIHILIKRKVLAHKMNLENSPHLIVPSPAILDLTYGQSPNALETYLTNGQERANALLAKPAQYWLDLLRDTISTPRVRVLARPSKAKSKELFEKEKERVKEQQEKLGPEGLKAAGERIKEAIESQILPPTEVLESIPVADTNKIAYRSIESYNATTEQPPNGFDLSSIPFRFHLDHIHSQFVRYYMFLNTTFLSQEDRPYLVLLVETWLQSPLNVGGKIVTLNEVIKKRSEDALSFYNDLGYKGSTFTPGSQSETIMFYSETLMEKYEEGMNLLKEALFNVHFTVERTKSIMLQMLNAIPGAKLKASSIVNVLSDNIYFDRASVIRHVSFLRQKKFLEKIQEQLENEPEKVLHKLHELCHRISQPSNVFVYMATDLNKLEEKVGGRKASEAWREFFPSDRSFSPKESLKERRLFLSERYFKDPNPPFRHAITGIHGSESCYLRQIVDFPITDWESKKLAAVRVALQYLTDQMYNLIRGKGLTYGVSISSSVTEGRMRVKFTRSSQLSEAYAVFRDIISKYIDPLTAPWDVALLQSAKGSQIYDWAEREETVENLSSVAVKSVLRGADDTKYNRRFISRIDAVTLDEVRSVAAEFLPAFLDPAKTQTAVACGPNDVQGMKEFFAGLGFDLNVIEDMEDSIMSN